MAEILARGWNVAIPEVDVGDDVFVAQDDGARLTRVQLKTTAAEKTPSGDWISGTIKLPYEQLMREAEAVPLTYAFAIRCATSRQFIVIARDDLRKARRAFDKKRETARDQGKRPRGSPRTDPENDANITFTLKLDDVAAWGGASFQHYRNNWDDFELLMLSSSDVSTIPDPSSSPVPPAAPGSAAGRS